MVGIEDLFYNNLEMASVIIRVGGFVFFSSRRRHTRYWRDWSSDVCSSDLRRPAPARGGAPASRGALDYDVGRAARAYSTPRVRPCSTGSPTPRPRNVGTMS